MSVSASFVWGHIYFERLLDWFLLWASVWRNICNTVVDRGTSSWTSSCKKCLSSPSYCNSHGLRIKFQLLNASPACTCWLSSACGNRDCSVRAGTLSFWNPSLKMYLFLSSLVWRHWVRTLLQINPTMGTQGREGFWIFSSTRSFFSFLWLSICNTIWILKTAEFFSLTYFSRYLNCNMAWWLLQLLSKSFSFKEK